MKKSARFCIFVLTACVMAMLMNSCNTPERDTDKAETVRATVVEIEKYGHAVMDITTADFMSHGYSLGDVVSVKIGGSEYIMPFFDGYYSNPGSLMLRGQKPQGGIAVCINYGDFCAEKEVEIGEVAEISIYEKAGMRDIQELYALQYSNNPDDYRDDTTFANFRSVAIGRIGEGKLYRSASPINNENDRAVCADDLIESVGVTTVLNLADSDEDLEGYMAAADSESTYYRSLYDGGRVIAIDLTGNFYSEEFAKSVARGFTFLAQNETPYLIHCNEGKDRTGFAAMLLEALMGATLEEITEDYMITFYNYYGIDKEREPDRYQAVLDVNLLEMLRHVTGAESVEKLGQINLETAVTDYLINSGMSEENILILKEKLG